MKITIILYMISLSVYASRSWAQQESAWALSANPVSISYVPKDSAMEAGLSYLIHQAALPASDQPDQTPKAGSALAGGWYRLVAKPTGREKMEFIIATGLSDYGRRFLGRATTHREIQDLRTSGLRLIPENQGRDRWRLYSYKQRRSLLLPYLPWDGTLNPDIRRYRLRTSTQTFWSLDPLYPSNRGINV